MTVFVHSLGSIWQTKTSASRATSIWNTTGIDDGKSIRPRSEVYGQVALGRRALLDWNQSGRIRPDVWIVSELAERAGIRKLQLIVRASAPSVVDSYRVTITEGFVGLITDDGWDPHETQIVSSSRWNQRQEIMLLVRPFGWLKGGRGAATLIPTGRGCEWRTVTWGVT